MADPLIRYRTWMEDLPEHLTKVPLSSLAIPGSHDSGTYAIDKTSGIAIDQPKSVKCLGSLCCGVASSVVSNWAKTQDYSLYQQLEIGVRYLDLRVCVKPGSGCVHFVHGMYGDNVLNAMTDVNDFLSHYKNEVVILDFNHFYNMDSISHRQLLLDLRRIFHERLLPFNTKLQLWQMTLENIWMTQMRVMIFYNSEHISKFTEFWPSYAIPSPWPNTSNVEILRNFLESNYSVKRQQDIGQFFVFQGILTPNGGTIFKHLFSSLKKTVALNATEAFLEWVAEKDPCSTGINICLADFVHCHNFIPSVLNLNNKIPRTR